MTTLEFVQEARRSFIENGPDKHFTCPAHNATGISRDRRCVMAQAMNVQRSTKWGSIVALEQAWKDANGVYPTYTNAHGFAAVVAGYDRLIAHLTPPAERVEPVAEYVEGLA